MANRREGFRRISKVTSLLLSIPLLVAALVMGIRYLNYPSSADLGSSLGLFIGALVAFVVPKIVYRIGIYVADGFKKID